MIKKQIIFIILLYFILSNLNYMSDSEAEITNNNENEIENWPFNHHDLQNTGFTSSYAPESNSIRWIFDNIISSDNAPYIAVNNVIYFGTSRPDNKFYAIDANSGRELWNITGDESFGICAFYDNIIYVSYGESVVAIDIITKEIIWQFSGKSYEYDFSNIRILVDDSGVYFPTIYSTNVRSRPTIESAVFKLNRNTGNPIFKFNTETNVLITTGLAIYQNNIYFGTSSHEVYCIDRIGNNDGTILNYGTTDLIWKKFLPDDNKTYPHDIYSTPSISNNILFVGGYDVFYALNVSSSDELWNFSTNDRITSNPSIDNSKVYIGSTDSYLYALDKLTGKQIWKFKSENPIDHTSQAIAGNKKLVFGPNENNLFCINTTTGREIWKYKFNSRIYFTPIIFNSTIYIFNNYKLFAFGSKIFQNTKPYFTKVEVEKSIANMSEEIDIIIEAQDDEGDKINFEYGCDGGKIEKLGSKWLWTAPNLTGFFHVYFNISDGKLNDSLVLHFEVVKPNEAPTILNITVDPTVIEPNCITNITVNALDNDGDDLDYIYKSTSGEIIGSGSMITWLAPKTEGIYEIEITVFDGELYSIPNSVNITVVKNYPPVIENIIYSSENIYINSEINFSIVVTDKNNDDLNYHYESDYGEIKGNGPNVTWYSPINPGTYSLTFWVDDGWLSSETKVIDLVVFNYNKPPVIEEIIVSSNKIELGETVKIEVKAIDPNEDDIISFFYETDYGYFSGEENIVFWHAPDKIGQYNITIIIKDSYGAAVSENISILVYDQDDSNNNNENVDSTGNLFDSGTIIILLIVISIIIIIAISFAYKSKINNFSKKEPIEVEPIEVMEEDK